MARVNIPHSFPLLFASLTCFALPFVEGEFQAVCIYFIKITQMKVNLYSKTNASDYMYN